MIKMIKRLFFILSVLAAALPAGAGLIVVQTAATDNSGAISNGLARGGSQTLPPGVFTLTNQVIINGTVNLRGDNTTLRYTLPAGQFALKFKGASSTCEGIRFVDVNATASTNVGAVFLNAVGLPKVERCDFNDSGLAVFVSGDGDISFRSNHWSVSSCTFSNFYTAILGAGNNQSEYGIVEGNRGTICRGGAAVAIGCASVVISGNNFNGWQDYSGGYGAVVGNGLQFWSDNGRGHSWIMGNVFAHFAASLNCSNVTGMTIISGNNFGGGASNRIANMSGLVLANNLLDTYSAQGTFMTNCTAPVVYGNFFQGAVIGFNGYSGFGNTLAGYGLSTNDYTSSPRGADIGLTTFSRDASFPGGYALRINTGNSINGVLLGDGLIQSAGLLASNYFGFPGGPLIYQSGAGMKLGSWNNGGNDKAGRLELGSLAISTNLAFIAAPTGTPGNTVTPANYIKITNAGALYYLPAFQ